MKRTQYDLKHHVMMAGKIGRLQTIGQFVVGAGDSLEIRSQGRGQLSPLRLPLSIDAQIEVFGFYVPFRHCYGDNWIDFIKQGIDESISFETKTITHPIYSLGQTSYQKGTIPKWVTHAYDSIWRRYFIDPTEAVDLEEYSIIDSEFFPTVDDDNAKSSRLFGARTLFPLRYWSGGIHTTTTDDDHKVNVTSDKLDIIDLEKIKMRYKTELIRDWFDRRYKEILESQWGPTVNIDADERPELLFRTKRWMSGRYVDGADDATLGQRKGIAENAFSFNMPRKFFDEHGSVWILMLVRFPTLHQDEIDYLSQKAQPSYLEIAQDPDLLRVQEPTSMLESDFIQGGSNKTMGVFPYGKWLREKGNLIHDLYKQNQGHPFITRRVHQESRGRYIADSDYEHLFTSLQFGHWQYRGGIQAMKYSAVPQATSSIFAGV